MGDPFVFASHSHNAYTATYNNETAASQVGILIRELCRLHNCPPPPDLDNLTLQFPRPGFREPLDSSPRPHNGHNGVDAESEDGEEDPDEIISDDQEGSDVEEDLPLEMDDGKNSNKVGLL